MNIDTLMDESGRVIYIKNMDNFETISYQYDASNKLKEINFSTSKNGVQYEKYATYHSNGLLKSEAFYYIINKKIYGKPQIDSTYKEFYENGKLKELRYYVNGKEDGNSVLYYPNGQIEAEMFYENDKLMHIKCYDTNGRAFDIGEFKEGNGKLLMYRSGVQIGFCLFKNGVVVKRSCKCE